MTVLLAPIALDLDGTAYLAALEELRSLARSLPEGIREFVVGIFDTPDPSSQLCTIEQDGLLALGARELRIRLKPSDRFLLLMAAVRAGNCDLAVVEKIFGYGHRYNLDGTS